MNSRLHQQITRSRGPLWFWVVASLALVAVMGYLRIVAYPDKVVPLAYSLPLLVALLHRDLRLLWAMAIIFVGMIASKMFIILPESAMADRTRNVFALMQVANTVVVAGVLHAVIRVTGRLEETILTLDRTNTELEASNEELAAREEEITQQNEELQCQAEELEQQMEELNSQSEELQTLNEQLAARERSLNDLLETTTGGAGESETLARIGEMINRLLGPRACGAAVVEPHGDRALVLPLFGVAPAGERPRREATVASLAVARDRAAFLADLSLRPDLVLPKLETGHAPASALAAPLRAREIQGAALEIYSREAGEWEEQDLRLAQWLAEQCGRLWTNTRLREDLDRQRDLLRTVTDNASAALILVDQDGCCTYMNPAAERLLGLSLAEAEGRSLHDLVHGAEYDGHGRDECPLHNQQQPGRARDDMLVRRGGERIPVICSAMPIAHKGRGGAVIEIRDVREERRAAREREELLDSERAARAEAQRASRAKDEFVATLSHELRTPLNAILGWATLLDQPNPEPAEVAKGLDVIQRNARHQAQLISDLLDISRISSGKIRLDVQPVDLPGVIDAALAAIRPAADAKGVHIDRVIEPIDRVVMGDPDRLQQIAWNLLTNAIKFTPGGGSVQVVLSRVASFVQFTVCDTGQGIDPETLPQLFERYRQADTSPARRFGGLGLGLAIVKHLVELHGGTVHARSDGPGKGSSFTVMLPVRAVEPAAPADQPHPESSSSPLNDGFVPRLAGVSVLVVDDEADARELIQRILQSRGAQVQTASCGEEALELLESAAPDLLISDIGMPGMDGYSLVRRIRVDGGRSPRELPAIALTAFARSEDRTRALIAGFQSHISKPVEPAELIATVASLAPAGSRARPQDQVEN